MALMIDVSTCKVLLKYWVGGKNSGASFVFWLTTFLFRGVCEFR